MAKKRKSLSKKTRFDVFKRDGFKCQYCGQCPPAIVLEVDHILPVARGGTNDETNLLTSCRDCNAGKSANLLTAVPEAIESQLQEQVERREQLEQYNAYLMEARERVEAEARRLGVYWCDMTTSRAEKGKWIVCNERLTSIKTFLKKLPAAEVYDAMDIASGRIRVYGRNDEKAWRYFCGVCWSKIKDGSNG